MEHRGNNTDPKNGRSLQVNLNTFLLAGCLALSGWTLFSINDLDSKVSALAEKVSQDHEAIYGNYGINVVIEDQSKTIEALSGRIIKLETLEAGRK